MKHLIKKEKNILHGTIGWSHNGKDGQYCEAGETVKIKWQPDAGWGLQEAHYTDGGGNVVAIEGGEFVMPDSAVVIGATFKRFVIEDWTGKDAAFSIIGSFDVANLPTLDGFNDAGKVAYVKDTCKYATWDGYGWTYMDGKPVTPRYLTFTANENGSSVGFWYYSENASVVDAGKQVEYSNDGVTWQPYTIGNADDDETPTMINLDKGDFVMFRGNNPNGISYYIEADSEYEWLAFVMNGEILASGDVTSLINNVGGDCVLHEHECYGMFNQCASLTQAPALPATTLASYCYAYMFSGCASLTQAPAIPATTLASNCYEAMFSSCTSLTQAPALPATTLASNCYAYMFSGCTNITSYDVATLNNSGDTFDNNSSCTSLTIHADTPPTIANSTITGLKADCIIYVPAASVDAYKAAQYWSARASYIQAIP